MKNILLLFLFCCYSFSSAQNNDAIPEDKVKVNDTIALGYTVEQVTAILGTPTEINNYYSEIDDENWKEHNYRGNLFYFYNNKLVEFELKNNLLYFYNSALKVGTDLSYISNNFPNSYNKRIDWGDNYGDITINIALPDSNISDQFISIQYIPSGIITSISTASY